MPENALAIHGGGRRAFGMLKIRGQLQTSACEDVEQGDPGSYHQEAYEEVREW